MKIRSTYIMHDLNVSDVQEEQDARDGGRNFEQVFGGLGAPEQGTCAAATTTATAAATTTEREIERFEQKQCNKPASEDEQQCES